MTQTWPLPRIIGRVMVKVSETEPLRYLSVQTLSSKEVEVKRINLSEAQSRTQNLAMSLKPSKALSMELVKHPKLYTINFLQHALMPTLKWVDPMSMDVQIPWLDQWDRDRLSSTMTLRRTCDKVRTIMSRETKDAIKESPMSLKISQVNYQAPMLKSKG